MINNWKTIPIQNIEEVDICRFEDRVLINNSNSNTSGHSSGSILSHYDDRTHTHMQAI